jgi:hypothetical protein
MGTMLSQSGRRGRLYLHTATQHRFLATQFKDSMEVLRMLLQQAFPEPELADGTHPHTHTASWRPCLARTHTYTRIEREYVPHTHACMHIHKERVPATLTGLCAGGPAAVFTEVGFSHLFCLMCLNSQGGWVCICAGVWSGWVCALACPCVYAFVSVRLCLFVAVVCQCGWVCWGGHQCAG